MDRWQDFGTLGKAATITGWGGAIGLSLAVLAGKMTDSKEAVWFVLITWYAPVIIWGLCALSVAARSNWPMTAGLATGVLVLGAMMDPSRHDELLWLLIGTPLFCAIMALFAEPARALLDIGKPPRPGR